MKKEFESDLETVDNDENAFLVRKSSSRRMKLGQTFDKLSKKSESSAKLIKRSVAHSIHKSQISLHFRIEILSVKPLPSNANNKLIFVTWRRGSKKKNTGQSYKTNCLNGVADFSALSPSPPPLSPSKEKEEEEEERNSFDLYCTLYQAKNKPNSQPTFQSSLSPYEEKTIAFQVKKRTSSGSSVIGHVIVNLAEFYEEGTKQKSFPLILRGGSTINTGSAKITSRELGTLKNQNEPLLLIPMIELRVSSELQEENEIPQNNLSNINNNNSSGNLSNEENGKTSSELSRTSSNSSIGKLDKAKEIFGKPILVALLQNGERLFDVAPFISDIAQEIINHSISRQGLFRLAGRGSKIQEIIDLINSGEKFEANEFGAHEIGDVLKRYIRSLPQPVFPLSLYDSFLLIGEKLDQCVSDINQDQMKEDVKKLINQFPVEHSALLRHLCYLLDAVAHRAEENLMGYENLSVVFGPTLLFKNDDDPLRILCDNPKKIAVFKFILLNWKSIWDEELDWSEVDKKLEENFPPEVRINKLKSQIEQLKSENEKITENYQTLEEKFSHSLIQIKTLQSDINILHLLENSIYIQPLQYINLNLINNNNNNNNDSNNKINEKSNEKNGLNFQSVVTFQLVPNYSHLQPSIQISIFRALISSINKTSNDKRWNCYWLSTTLQLYKYLLDQSTNKKNDQILINLQNNNNNGNEEKISYDEIPFLATIEKMDDLLVYFNQINRHLFTLISRSFQSRKKEMGEMVELIFKESQMAVNTRQHENTSIIDPIMECIFDKLISILYDHYIYQSVIKQFATKSFEYIAQSAISSLVLNENICTSKIGLRIKLNICQFEYWISSKLSPQSPLYSILIDSISSLSPITQAANFLVTASNFSSNFDAKDLKEFFSELSSSQIVSLLKNFKPEINNAREKDKFEKDRVTLLRQFSKS